MKSKKVLTQLIEQLAVFEAENPHLETYELSDFLSFMESRALRNYGNVAPMRKDGGGKIPEGFDFHQDVSVILSRLISLLYRYAKEYTKKALDGSKLQTAEEFSFLVVLMTYNELSKTELIQKNVMGKTSGTEVIKRLLKKGLIGQFPDADDKRVQLVAITPKGLEEMKKVFPKMQMASKIISGNLTANEQRTLIFLLQKLEAYHHDLFFDHQEEGLEDLLRLRGETAIG